MNAPDLVSLLAALGLSRHAAAIVVALGFVGYLLSWLAAAMPAPRAGATWLELFLYTTLQRTAANVWRARNAKDAGTVSPGLPRALPSFAVLWVLLLVAIAVSACGEIEAGEAAVNSYAGQAIGAQQKNIEGLNDNVAKGWAAAGCATPYGEVVRNGSGNPNLPKAIIELCGSPSGTTIISTTPAASAVTTVPTATVQSPIPRAAAATSQ